MASPPRNQLDPDTFSQQEQLQIRQAIREKYKGVAASAEGKFKYPTGKEGAAVLGYDSRILNDIPDALLSSFCGVGNPFSLGDILAGNDVLDIGSGAGFDLIVASRLAGPEGRACGIDLTLEMVERSRETFNSLGVTNIEVHHVFSETIPYEDETFDVVISNGVINLSPCKSDLFKEVHRVLKPGGRLQFADMVLDKDLPPGMAGNLEAWSQ